MSRLCHEGAANRRLQHSLAIAACKRAAAADMRVQLARRQPALLDAAPVQPLGAPLLTPMSPLAAATADFCRS